jgi:hypothetical protein
LKKSRIRKSNELTLIQTHKRSADTVFLFGIIHRAWSSEAEYALMPFLTPMTRAPRTERLEQLFRGLRRAMGVVYRLHLPEFQYAIEHGNRHGNNQKPGKPPFPCVLPLAVGDVAGDD